MNPIGISDAVIIAVGSELLTSDRLDTNSVFLTSRLNDLGVTLTYKVVVGDHMKQISDAVRAGMSAADIVLITGGLGPTSDDVTREAVAAAFGMPLEEHAPSAELVRERFKARDLEMPEINLRQALIPAGAEVLVNKLGTAPGMWVRGGDAMCLVLPGPPREMQPMFMEASSKWIEPLCESRRLQRRVISTCGRTESFIEATTYPVYSRLRGKTPSVETSILASSGQVDLWLSTRSVDNGVMTRVLEDAANEISRLLGDDLVSTDGSTLEEVVGRLLRESNSRLTVAESCTGGLVFARLTNVPGSSDYLGIGWVVYSNEAKVEILGVDRKLIETEGAVSELVAVAMAKGARIRANTDFSLSITGIAGPGGGSADKPVGRVFISLAGPEGFSNTKKLNLRGSREEVRAQAALYALDLLRRALIRVAKKKR